MVKVPQAQSATSSAGAFYDPDATNTTRNGGGGIGQIQLTIYIQGPCNTAWEQGIFP